jgi:hypothetical protein
MFSVAAAAHAPAGGQVEYVPRVQFDCTSQSADSPTRSDAGCPSFQSAGVRLPGCKPNSICNLQFLFCNLQCAVRTIADNFLRRCTTNFSATPHRKNHPSPALPVPGEGAREVTRSSQRLPVQFAICYAQFAVLPFRSHSRSNPRIRSCPTDEQANRPLVLVRDQRP